MTDDLPELTRRPAKASSALSALALGAAVLAAAPFSSAVFWGGAVATPLLGVGLWSGSRRFVTLGCSALLLGVLVAGVQGLPAVPTLASVTAAVVAWDAGHQAVGVGEQLGRESSTVRAELPHVGATATVGLAASTVCFVAFVLVPGGLPVAAVAFALLGALALLAALRAHGD